MPDGTPDIESVRSGDAKELADANLRDADLWDADFRRADLRDADFRRANLWDADLRDANLWDANLRDTTLPAYERLPETGAFVAYKGCSEHVVRVRVPAAAERVSSLVGPKCRAEYVETVEVLDAEGNPCDATQATSWWDDGETVYREGETTHPDDWDDDIRVECTHGIHIYPTKREAVEAVQDD
jgi:hypothetical protein